MSIIVNHLSKIYGAQKAVNDISFTINKGEIVGFFKISVTAKSVIIKKIYILIVALSFYSTIFAQNDKRPFNLDSFIRKQDSIRQTAIGKPYPDFEHLGEDGIVYSNKKMLGKKYYINFWFEGCHPCMDEMNSLIILNDKLKNTNNEFISFTFDIPSTIKRVKENKKINFKIIHVTDKECRRLNFNSGFPQHIVVDEKGNVEYIGSSFKNNEDTIKEIADLLINKSTIQ
jgi:peroxiredoxin